MTKAVLAKNLLCTTAGMVTVYNFDGVSREYSSPTVEVLPVGVGIPAHSCTDKPPGVKAGMAVIRNADNTAWLTVPDHRGETVYCTLTGAAVPVTLPGEYPDNTTRLAPSTAFDGWTGTEWVTDTEAQHTADMEAAEQQKAALLAKAQATISLWQTELQLGILSDEDKSRLIAWMNYIKVVQAVNTSIVPDITWPNCPDA